MKRAYRRGFGRTSRPCPREVEIVEPPDLATGDVVVELPVRLAAAARLRPRRSTPRQGRFRRLA